MKKVSSIRSLNTWHLVGSLLMLFMAVLAIESGSGLVLFYLTSGLLFLILAFSKSSFFARANMDALVLWCEAVCFLLASLSSFAKGKDILPWLFIILAVVYARKGLLRAGLKIKV